MAGISEFSNKVVFTSDNPRNEDPDVIAEMELGVEAQNHKKVLAITDRRQAIKKQLVNWRSQMIS
jgi:UDP-N-acetylmuramoyl-L-alanyl-D-glutamate--2,6-diaminopimelate ligase